MTDYTDHIIKKSIQKCYARKLLPPVIFLIILLIFMKLVNIQAYLTPVQADASIPAQTYFEQDIHYVDTNIDTLYYTGYTCTRLGRTAGYFYYADFGNSYTFFLLSPDECKDGQNILNNVHLLGKIVLGGYDYQVLLTAMADDLGWTYSDICANAGDYYISSPDYRYKSSLLLSILCFACAIYALLNIVAYIIFIIVPFFSTPIRRLGRFGNARQLITLAEEELSTLPQLATEDMFITEHFFIELSRYGVTIIPIHEIVWIYKNSKLHKFLWISRDISYTLHIVCTHNLSVHCPRNTKSSIDGIIDYLAEANQNLLTGFSPENRQAVKSMLHEDKLAHRFERKRNKKRDSQS